MNETIMIGLGNPLLQDEGVGVHLLQQMEARSDEFPGVDFIDLGTAGARVLHAIAGRKKAVFVDCTFMDEAPGTIRRFAPDEVRSGKNMPAMSLHEGDLLKFIALSATLGECPDDIVIFGIQPETVSDGRELSETLASRTGEYLATIIAELRS